MIEHDKLKFLKEGWQKEIHIVSAGPSLRGFDFNCLKSKIVMTLNNSIYHLPDRIKPLYHVYCEPVDREIENYIKMANKPYTKYFSLHNCSGWIQIPPFKDTNNFAFEVAIKIAEAMDYKTINLYGYDFSTQDSFIYWWDEQPRSEEEVGKKTALLGRQKTIFKQFIHKISKDIKINIVTSEGMKPIKDYK